MDPGEIISTDDGQEPKRHLRRLSRVWVDHPIYFITTVTHDRQAVLARSSAADVLVEEWIQARTRHGWSVGRYVVMPDHVHFFASPGPEATTLSRFMNRWKEWTAKRITKAQGKRGGLWQAGFFDHLLRSAESYHQQWLYAWNNPVRGALVRQAEDWPYKGEIVCLGV